MTTDEKALELHKQFRGKLETISKVPLKNKEDLSIAYTPGVAAVCRAIAQDTELAKEYTIKRNTIAVVTDGSAVLGLGNIGPEAALPVMEGKCVLFKEFAGVDAFPICVHTQDTEEIINIVKNIAPTFGGINLEDIAAPRCFEIERRLKSELAIPVMHDDQHGTATVVLAGLINALKLKGQTPKSTTVVINGAGAAGIAIADLLLLFGFTNLILLDSTGILYPGREKLDPDKERIAKITNVNARQGGLETALPGADVFIGVSKAGLLTKDLVALMNPEPIVFALANPIPEIMPDIATEAGAFIVATGRSDFPNQINNVLAFPGIFRGALDAGASQITNTMLIKAAEKLAALVNDPSIHYILPDPFDPRVAPAIASAIT